MFKLCVMGDPSEIHHFINDFQTQPQYKVKLESKEYVNNERKIVANVDFIPKVHKPLHV